MVRKKPFSVFVNFICLSLALSVILPAKSIFAQTDENIVSDEDLLLNDFPDMDVNFSLLELIEELPDEVASKGIDESVKWLNKNKGDEFVGQEFIADGEYLKLLSDFNEPVMSTSSVSGCIWGIGKAIAMNALPWSKILKIKKAVKIMGGTRVVANALIKAYKHQRNLGYSRAKSIKKAINVTKRALPAEYAKHWLSFSV
ncbi:hypothetical protein [Bacillus safensis]|uniref:hypothetical protein n=1 Tax=Bacillus safensis TaxID=561879 RepID=UPI003981B94E